MKRLNIRSPQAPTPDGPFGQAVSVEAQRLTWFSAQLPIDPITREVSASEDPAEQARLVLQYLHALLESAGLNFDNLVDVTVYVTDLADVAHVDDAFRRWLGHREPARTVVKVTALPGGARIQVDAVAAS